MIYDDFKSASYVYLKILETLEKKWKNVDFLSKLIKGKDVGISKKKLLLSLAVKCYINSCNDDYGNKVFSLLIEPNLTIFTDEQIKKLVYGIEKNSTYEQERTRIDHVKILEEVEKRTFSLNEIAQMKCILNSMQGENLL